MNKIAELIKTHAAHFSSVFVFPTQAEAREWFIRSLEVTEATALPEDMFIAWDTFKTKFLYSDETRKPISQIIRKIFVYDMIRRNEKQKEKIGTAIFKKIILEKFLDSASNLTSWLVSILPQLDNLARKANEKHFSTDEISEFLLLKTYYEKFLQKHGLYEPSWVPQTLKLNHEKIKIIFPELIDDFFELKTILEKNTSVELIHTDILEKKQLQAVEFDDSRTELDFCISKIEALLTDGVPANDIAATVCNLDELKPYLQREAELRGIPLEFRSGAMLGATQAGQFFSQVQTMVNEHFSFDSLNRLFLNTHLVWKEPALMQKLLKFGIEKNCVASWEEKGKWKNCWEEAFSMNEGAKSNDEFEIESFFRSLKTLSENIVASKNFTEIKKNYQRFRSAFFMPEKFFIDDDLILARCVEKLKTLSLLDDEFKTELPENVFGFFVSVLDETIYVYKNNGVGVSVFNFQVMAISPYRYNFLLNANQKAARADFGNLTFLRNDIRKRVGADDTDASPHFFKSYYHNENAFISFAKKTFSDYAMVHPACTKRRLIPDEEKIFACNSFSTEEKYFCISTDVALDKSFIPYMTQQQGVKNFFDHFKIKQKNDFSILKNGFETKLHSPLDEKLKRFCTNDNFTISATQLKKFYACPSFYFLETVLGIERQFFAPMLFTPLSAGILSHGIIEKILTHISITDRIFIEAHYETYVDYAKKIILDDVNNSKLLNGSFSKPFTNIIVQKKISEIEALLNYFVKNYSGFSIPVIEKELIAHFENYNLAGKIDASFCDDSADFTLIDFKSSWTPKLAESRVTDRGDAVTDFQIAMYVYLLEHNSASQDVGAALFWSLAKKMPVHIIGEKNTRVKFEPTIEKLHAACKNFFAAVSTHNFSVGNIHERDCMACTFAKVCRTKFQVEGEIWN